MPSNWPDFLRNSENKEDLFKLLGTFAIEKVKNLVHIVTNLGEVRLKLSKKYNHTHTKKINFNDFFIICF